MLNRKVSPNGPLLFKKRVGDPEGTPLKYHTLNISRAAITYQHLFERKITKMAVLYFEETNRACGTVCRTCMLCEGITRRINGICAMCKVTWVYGRSYPGYRVLCLIGKEMPCKYMYLPN